MSDGTLFKPEKDHSKEADKILPEAEALSKVGQGDTTQGKRMLTSAQKDIQKGIDKILLLEKQARQVRPAILAAFDQRRAD